MQIITLKRTFVALPVFVAACSTPFFAAEAKELKYKEMPFEIREGERLVVNALKGQVKIIPNAGGRGAILRARKSISDRVSSEEMGRFEALSFSVRREGGAVVVEPKGPDSKTAWASWIKSANAPEMSIELEAPQVPLEIFVREGQIAVQNWRQPVAASLVSGTIRSSGGDSSLKAQIQRGEVRLERHKGGASIDSYGAKVVASDVEGGMSLTNFGGETTLSSVHGHLDLKNHAGSMSIAKSSGSLDFLAGRAGLNIQGFEGPIRGQTDLGAVSVAVEGETEVSIESNQGNVSVKLPANSGASVRMQSDEGSVAPPEGIRPSGSGKSATGKLLGTGPKGSVVVRSKSGALRVR